MALEQAKKYLEERGYGDRVKVFEVSSATVELTPAELEVLSGGKGWVDVCN